MYRLQICCLRLAVSPAWAETSVSLSQTPPDFKIAFIGDQGLGKNADKSIWRICSWHQNMHLMQVGKQRMLLDGMYTRKQEKAVRLSPQHTITHTATRI